MTTKPSAPEAPNESGKQPEYQNARGCLAMLAIAVVVLGVMVAMMYFFGDHPAAPSVP